MRPVRLAAPLALLLAAAPVLAAAPEPAGEAPEEVALPPPPSGPAPAPAEEEPEAPPPGEPVPPAPPRPDDLAFRSADGRYLARIGLQSAYKFEPVFLDGDEQPRASFLLLRGIVAGSLYRPWIRFWTSIELAANPPHALDAYVELQPIPELGVRLGQQYIPFSRHESYGPAWLLFPDWDVVANYFWAGWDKGITVLGTVGEGRLEYYAGMYVASPLRQFRSVPGNYQAAARVTVSPAGPLGPTEMPWAFAAEVPFRWSFSLQGYAGRARLAEENFNPSSGLFEVVVPTGRRSRRATAGADVALQVDRFSFLAEAYARRTEPEGRGDSFTSTGAWAQLGLGHLARDTALGLRLSRLDPSDTVDEDRLLSLEASGTWYLDPGHLHLQLRYGLADQSAPEGEEPLEAPLPLAPGLSQVFTVQCGVFF